MRWAIPKAPKSVRLDEALQLRVSSLAANDPLRTWVAEMNLVLGGNIFAGESIKKQQIPAHYVKKFGVNNLFRYRLPEGFRAIYTLVREGDDVSVLVLEVLDHKNYDKRFGY